MATVKHKSSSNVGITLLIIAGCFAPHAEAAYRVWDWGEPTQAAQTPQARIETAEQSFNIPFFLGRDYFGPRGRKAMQKTLNAARMASTITIIGRPDSSSAGNLQDRRAATIQAWLIARGVRRDCIVIETGTEAFANILPNVFDSEIRISYRQSIKAERNQRTDDYVVAPSKLHREISFPTSELSSIEDSSALIQAKTPAAMPTPQSAHIWRLTAGKTLRAIIAEWCHQAGWNPPVWQAADPYYNENDYRISGSLIEAITQIAGFVPMLDFTIALKQRRITVTEKR